MLIKNKTIKKKKPFDIISQYIKQTNWIYCREGSSKLSLTGLILGIAKESIIIHYFSHKN